MQLTSTFVLAALFALKATSVIAVPLAASDEVANVEAREFYDELDLEAREFDMESEIDAREFDELDFEAREFDDEFELEARDFDDYQEVEARVFSPGRAIATANKVRNTVTSRKPTGGSRTGGLSVSNKLPISGSHSRTGGARKLPGGAVHRTGGSSRLGGSRIGGSRQGSRQGLGLKRGGLAHGSGSRVHTGGRTGSRTASRVHAAGGRTGHTVSRFQSKLNSEKSEMRSEEAKIHSEEARLKKQGSEMKLQEEIHRDRQQLSKESAF